MPRINWTAYAYAEQEAIAAALERECIERRNAFMALKARKALKVAVYVHDVDRSVAPTAIQS